MAFSHWIGEERGGLWVRPGSIYVTSVDVPQARAESQGHASCRGNWEMTSCLSQGEKMPLVVG